MQTEWLDDWRNLKNTLQGERNTWRKMGKGIDVASVRGLIIVKVLD